MESGDVDPYLARHGIPAYIKDAICLVLEHGTEDPLPLVRNYFSSLLQGYHVVGAEFEFIQSVPRNRLCFIVRVMDQLDSFMEIDDFSLTDLHEVLLLLCPNFPLLWIQRLANGLGCRVDSQKKFIDLFEPFKVLVLLHDTFDRCHALLKHFFHKVNEVAAGLKERSSIRGDSDSDIGESPPASLDLDTRSEVSSLLYEQLCVIASACNTEGYCSDPDLHHPTISESSSLAMGLMERSFSPAKGGEEKGVEGVKSYSEWFRNVICDVALHKYLNNCLSLMKAELRSTEKEFTERLSSRAFQQELEDEMTEMEGSTTLPSPTALSLDKSKEKRFRRRPPKP